MESSTIVFARAYGFPATRGGNSISDPGQNTGTLEWCSAAGEDQLLSRGQVARPQIAMTRGPVLLTQTRPGDSLFTVCAFIPGLGLAGARQPDHRRDRARRRKAMVSEKHT